MVDAPIGHFSTLAINVPGFWRFVWTRGLLAMTICFAIAGCSKPAILLTRGDADRYIREAREHEEPRKRREAITRLAESRLVDEPRTVRALCDIARNDSSEHVRLAAVRALGEVDGPDAVQTLVAILEAGSADPVASGRVQARPAGPELRFDAMRVLVGFVEDERLSGAEQETVCATAVALLAGDPARDVRLSAARFLGYCPSGESLDALVEALRQNDFGIVYESEHSLMRLTGMAFDHDYERWRQWLDDTEEPFADRGALDHQLREKEGRWWWPFGSG